MVYLFQGFGDGSVKKVDSDGVNSTHTGDTAETELKSVTVTGGKIGANGILSADIYLVSAGTNGTKTYRLKLGGTTLFTLTDAGATVVPRLLKLRLFNRNSQSSNYMNLNWKSGADETGSGAGLAEEIWNDTFSINTSVDVTLQLTVQLANGGDTGNCRGWFVRVFN